MIFKDGKVAAIHSKELSYIARYTWRSLFTFSLYEAIEGAQRFGGIVYDENGDMIYNSMKCFKDQDYLIHLNNLNHNEST